MKEIRPIQDDQIDTFGIKLDQQLTQIAVAEALLSPASGEGVFVYAASVPGDDVANYEHYRFSVTREIIPVLKKAALSTYEVLCDFGPTGKTLARQVTDSWKGESSR